MKKPPELELSESGYYEVRGDILYCNDYSETQFFRLEETAVCKVNLFTTPGKRILRYLKDKPLGLGDIFQFSQLGQPLYAVKINKEGDFYLFTAKEVLNG